MDFDFTDDQESLRDAVRRWVDKGFSFERRHAIAKAGGATREVYGELAELGLTALAIPEAQGGMGFGPIEAMVVNEELGRGLVNAPYAHAAIVAPTLLSAAPADLQAQWLPKIADASALVVLAHQERAARYRLNHVTTKATKAGNNWTLSGAKSIVPAGDEADAFIVPARTAGADADAAGIALFLVAKGAQGLAVRGYPTQDGARAAELTLANTPATLIALDALPLLEQAVDAGIAAICAEAVGVMDKLVAITAEYMNTRKQFGVPIATFQALRHRIADVKMQLELARSMSYYASLKLGEAAPVRRRAIAQAKYQLGQSMRFVGQQCIQLHGGIGVTDEYAGSHYFKRLTVLEMTFGDSLHQLGEVSARMQDTAGVFA
ncbi:MAG: acyl-CoA dehydrogenase family protein [Piscinibacter sp.]|uniref:acyl-CoA dehydrogenase family protein n=1 Tax=Piscinibacter sp. TaxID=1903157 RepID=UPI001B68654C|nr:acyl-CoA dehydrogenase family protein [Piscinibacter sp.]MBP5991875.1 acyl-CoA dehydrogenase family protein [Piscinibacter sp.]MBP6029285.1 acyl-CoA dehydrogenase family protein [Piscinibacter sp.]